MLVLPVDVYAVVRRAPVGCQCILPLGASDFFVTLDGCRLPLQSAVLGAGCRALCQALATAGSAASAKEAAVQGVFNGQPLTHLQLFLRLLYGGSAGAAQGEDDPWSLAAIAHELDAPCVLQASALLKVCWQRAAPHIPALTCLS